MLNTCALNHWVLVESQRWFLKAGVDFLEIAESRRLRLEFQKVDEGQFGFSDVSLWLQGKLDGELVFGPETLVRKELHTSTQSRFQGPSTRVRKQYFFA